MSKVKVTNISTGPRGAYLGGALVMAQPGETIEVDDFAEEWFARAPAKDAKETKAEGDKA